MIRLSQQDSRWATVTLGQSKLPISKYGCTTTCISMLSDYFKCYKNPAEIAQHHVKYTLDGLILWNTLKLEKMEWHTRIRERDDKAIKRSLNDPDEAVILQVNNGAHWVTAVSESLFGKDFWVIDPWDGKKKLACRAYKNIVGSSHFRRK
jgi:hypothetical protein